MPRIALQTSCSPDPDREGIGSGAGTRRVMLRVGQGSLGPGLTARHKDAQAWTRLIG